MRYLLSVMLIFSFTWILAGGIKGTVKSEDGEPLPFTTIYVKEVKTGTTTNEDAYYEINLKPGNYQIVFQYVGYESLTKEVNVENDFVNLNVVLRPQVMVLQDIEIRAGKEDPAYTIMRKAIAKSKFHTQQINRYTARVYIKGTGQLKDYPFFMKGTMKKEGIDPDRVFISESVSDIEYIRPNTYNEKVISIYTTGDNRNTSPNAYINGSFYEPEVAKAISPLSPKAFSYYRFEYDGTYRDQGFEVSRIKVIPRSRGDNVFTGVVNIVEDYWSIYSLNLNVTKMGIKFNIEQVYKPIDNKAWLPVTHKFFIEGKVLGFEFEGNYLATVSNYDIEINPDLDVDIEVVDEKVEKDLAEKLEEQVKDKEQEDIQKMLTSGKEVTRKQLRKVLKAYEKGEIAELDEPEIISNTTYKVDSLAYERDSSYWNNIRPVPLTEKETEGYHITDSIAQVEKRESEGDTLVTKRKRDGFKLYHLLLGGNYKLSDKTYFEIHLPNVQYNTVEGFNFDYRLSFKKTFENGNWLQIGPTARYAFARKKLSGFFSTHYSFGSFARRNDLKINLGRYVNQFNSDEPIHPIINTFMTLFLERNYMKIYEKDFISLNYGKKLTDKLSINLFAQAAERKEIFNHTDYHFFDRSGIGFTPNAPSNIELPDTSFPDHRAVTSNISFTYQPWLKYYKRNDKKYPVNGSSPIFELAYHKGISGVFESDVDYDLLEAGVKYDFNIGIRGLVDFKVKAGTFLNNSSMYFMDYKHFPGNRTPFATADPVGSFRLLDYYTFSTKDYYVAANLHYQFRKFLITRIPIVRLAGVRESFFTNYLANDHTSDYTELGYGINYIFRIFRIEAVTSFEGGKYRDFGVRLGIAANLDDIF